MQLSVTSVLPALVLCGTLTTVVGCGDGGGGDKTPKANVSGELKPLPPPASPAGGGGGGDKKAAAGAPGSQ
jgi:hypothetical protein